MDNKEKLKQIRQQIDSIDSQLIALFEQRMNTAEAVADIKKAENLALTDDDREQSIVERAIQMTETNLAGEVTTFMRTIMALSKAMQKKYLMDSEQPLLPQSKEGSKLGVMVAYQGIKGAWGEQACLKFFPENPNTSFDNFEDVFIGVSENKVSYGIVPIENSQTGAIGEVYDLLRKYGCYIVGQTWVDVNHCLMGTADTSLKDIREVFSHPEGFRQCHRFLRDKSWDLTVCNNTAIAADMVAKKQEKRYAAIGSPRAAEINNLKIIEHNIIDDAHNKTRFIVIASSPEYTSSSDTVSITFITAHRSGALCDVLFPLMAGGVNLSRIESRPVADGKYCFFADLKGNIQDEKLAAAVKLAASNCIYLEVLGCYNQI